MSCPGYAEVHCATCGIAFQVTDDFEKRRREDHKGFDCPNGHSNVWDDETKKEKRIRELEVRCVRAEDMALYWEEQAQAWMERAEHEERRRTGYQGYAAKLRLLA